jgi:hypothetical protein
MTRNGAEFGGFPKNSIRPISYCDKIFCMITGKIQDKEDIQTNIARFLPVNNWRTVRIIT